MGQIIVVGAKCSYPRHEGVRAVVQLHSFLTTALDRGQWKFSRHLRFAVAEGAPYPPQMI